jgi:hypothetical protein
MRRGLLLGTAVGTAVPARNPLVSAEASAASNALESLSMGMRRPTADESVVSGPRWRPSAPEGCGSEPVIPLTWTEERFRARSE